MKRRVYDSSVEIVRVIYYLLSKELFTGKGKNEKLG